MGCFVVEFISPDRKKSFDNVRSLTARTNNGEFVVMADHEMSVMDLLSGTVSLQGDNSEVTVVLISQAVLSVDNNLCVIMADCFALQGDNKEKLASLKDKLSAIAEKADEPIGELVREDLRYIDMVLKA